MRASSRAGFVAAGAGICLLAYYVVPGLYAVRFAPPAGSPHAGTALNKVPGFPTLGNEAGVVFRHADLPGSFVLVLIGVIVAAVVGLAVAAIDGRAVDARLRRWLPVAGLAGLGLVVAHLVWLYSSSRVPASITDRFVQGLGGGPDAVEAARFLSGEPSFATALLLLGLCGLLAGLYPIAGAAGLVLSFAGGAIWLMGWERGGTMLGSMAVVAVVLYVLIFRTSLVLSLVGLLIAGSVLLYGVVVVLQGAHVSNPLNPSGSAMTITMNGSEVSGKVYMAIGAAITLLGLLFVSGALRAIVAAWREGHVEPLEDPPPPPKPQGPPPEPDDPYTRAKLEAELRRPILDDD